MTPIYDTCYTLTPLDHHKSFYDKAMVRTLNNGVSQLISYNTVVCECDADGNFTRLWGGWSATTQRHVNAFIQTTHCKAECGKAYWMKQEVK